MACLVYSGRTDACKTFIGGLKNIYVANYAPDLFTILAGEVTGIAVGLTEVFKYELRADGNLTATEGVSDKNTGTTVFNQSLSAVLIGQDKDTALQLKLLMQGYQYVIVQDRMDNYRLLGSLEGGSVTASSILSGGAHADFNGFNMTWTSTATSPPETLDSATVVALLALVSATNITP
jgi:hypothetical protein